MMLNIGCGDDPRGDIRIDLFRTKTANVVGDAERLPFRDGTFSEVYERNIFEHMPNPALHLDEVKRVMAVGGVLTLITDNAACLKYYVLGTHIGGYRKHGGEDVHYSLFTTEHMRNFMKHSGLKTIQVALMDTEYPTWPFDRVVRLFAPRLSFPRILVKAAKTAG